MRFEVYKVEIRDGRGVRRFYRAWALDATTAVQRCLERDEASGADHGAQIMLSCARIPGSRVDAPEPGSTEIPAYGVPTR